MPAPLLYESHLHTPLCNHSIGEPEEYAAEAVRKNLRGIIVTCHNPIPNGYSAHVRMRENQFNEYIAMVARARDAWSGRVDIRLGLECDFAPGLESDVAILLKRAEFHHILGSIHTQVMEYRARFRTGSFFEYQQIYFKHLAMAAETGLFDTLAHPDLVKNEAPSEWNLTRIFSDIQRALDRIAATGTAMELNTSGLHKAIPEMNPGPEILAEMRLRNIPVVLGADAHIPRRVGADYPLALRMLQSAGYEHVSFFLDRQRQDILITDALASLETPPDVA